MIEILQRESIYLWYYFSLQCEQILPYWLIGILIGSIISVFGKEKIHAAVFLFQEKRLGILGLFFASLIGIASPLCMYGTIPIAASFSKKGIKDDWLAAFMMSSILLNPQLLIYSASLGTTLLLIRLITCFFCGFLAGLLIRVFYHDKVFFNFAGFEEKSSRDTDTNLFIRLIKNIGRNTKATGIFFFVGIILSSVFQRYVPASVVENLFGESNKGFGVLMAAAIGVPLYACGGGTIPLISAWLANGMSIGSAAAFMISGPATKITNLGALKIVLGAKRFLLYIIFSIVFAWGSGIIVDLFF
ncbi:MAG: permease [Treponema sp.]|jgi:uncharacterized membrane protein YraQ (UPF0718 family)|nr:permease [Treponema sp.]